MTIRPGLSYYLYHIIWSGLDLLFPPHCGGCGKLGQRWCSNCQQALTPVPLPVCEFCGEPRHVTGICPECNSARPAYQMLRSCAVFKEPLRPALHRLKYRRNFGLGEVLAWEAARTIEQLKWQAEAILPIPLSQSRLQERGYNQVGLIAYPLSLILNWQYLPGALQRARHTRTQVGLNAVERQQNVLGAFLAKPHLVKGKTLLLMDDVATTGATLNSASQALISAGAARVYALTIAKALPRYGLDQTEHISIRPLR